MSIKACAGRAYDDTGHIKVCPLRDDCVAYIAMVRNSTVDADPYGPYDFEEDTCSRYEVTK